jgi:hypothetical protein
MDHSGQTYAPGPPRKFPDSLLEPDNRFRRQAPLRHFTSIGCEEDVHLQAIEHARRTNKKPRPKPGLLFKPARLEDTLVAGDGCGF